MAQSPRTEPGRRGRVALRIVLFVSLALNLAVVGLVAGIALSGGPPERSSRPGGADVAMPYTRALSDAQRRDLRRALRREVMGDRAEARALRRDVTDGYRRAIALLRADAFDPAALEAVMAAQAARSAEVRARGQAALSAYLNQMTPEARAAYAVRLEEVVEKLERRWRRHGDKGRDEGR